MNLNLLTLAGDDFKHYPQNVPESSDNLSGMGFWGTVLPDFGFPDKKMTGLLNDIWPADDWDRGQVYDVYKWYATAITKGQKPFNADSNYNPIYTWVKNNSTYTDVKINHWFAMFKRGIQENWISGDLVGDSLAPEHEAKKTADFLKN